MKEMSHLHMLAIRITNSCVTAWWQSAQTGPVSLCNDLSCQTVTNGPISAERRVHQSLRCGTRRSGPETVCFKPPRAIAQKPWSRRPWWCSHFSALHAVTWCSLADGIRFKFLILVSDSTNGIASSDILYCLACLLLFYSVTFGCTVLTSEEPCWLVLVCEFPCFDLQMVEQSAFQCHKS